MNYPLFVSCPKGMEYLLENELANLAFSVTQVTPQGVYGSASLEIIYRVCLWSRLASRVQLVVGQGPALNQQELYTTCRDVAWDTLFEVTNTIAVEFHGESEAFRHSLFGAQVVKDAVVDYFRECKSARPMVERLRPDVLLHAYLKHDTITISIDLTGYSLHQRGYRLQTGLAPIKEHVAAAMLVRANWPQLLAEGYAFHDPCCGSGTLVIEAVMMAANIAPGLLRTDQAFVHWLQHDAQLWERVRNSALKSQRPCSLTIEGSDADAKLITIARANAARAGVSAWIDWQVRSVEQCSSSQKKGLLVTNPPYGVRLGEEVLWVAFYQQLGELLYKHYQGWHAAILTPSALLAKAIGLRSHKQYTLYNGALACKLYCFTLDASNQLKHVQTAEQAPMFANRLRKNHLAMQKWAQKHAVDCYRLYDADLPEYAFAIDCYADYVVMQEYMPPSSIDASKAQTRRVSALAAISEVLNVPPERIINKQRKAQKGRDQYEKLAQKQLCVTVKEGNALFKVN